jgi:hypothetical protein
LGQWQPATIAPDQAAVRFALVPIFVASAAGLAWSLWKQPSGYMLLVFGFGYVMFVTGMFGLTAYLSTWVWWLPISRRFEFPILFGAVLLAVVLLVWLPGRSRFWSVRLGWAGVVVGVVVSQLLWLPIQQVFGNTEPAWKATVANSEELGRLYNQPGYAGHALAVPPDRPDITYGLAMYGHVEGKHLVSEMYDPLAYLPAGYGYEDHMPAISSQVQCWLSANDIRLIAVATSDTNLEKVVGYTPDWFTQIAVLEGAGWEVYAVNPAKPSSTCDRVTFS